ncbi:hypothetical protein Pmani_025074 [Petrolisthes manimaculis]|uniref:Peptidase S1 domain-containing protein n=1 Tax=Petrolisthes manimaculis TaxID=1843537 RepID=A0AAE1TZB3_9EUCA|nr:hypothetical protein Pmani_025074 [Petrolisthes manimaculis]
MDGSEVFVDIRRAVVTLLHWLDRTYRLPLPCVRNTLPQSVSPLPDKMWWCSVLMLPILLSIPSVTTLQTAAGLTDVDAQLLAVIPVISTRINGSPASTSISTFSSSSSSSSCVTPEGHQGVCGRVSECPTYAHLVKDIQDKNVVQFFLNRVCRALPNAIHICCPQIGTLGLPGTHTRVDATPSNTNVTTTPKPSARRPILGAGPPRTVTTRPQSNTTPRRPSPNDTRPQLGSPQPSQPGASRPSQPGASRPSLQRPNDRQPIVGSDSESSDQEVPVGGVSSLGQPPPLPPLPSLPAPVPAPALPPQLQPRPTIIPQQGRPQQRPQVLPQPTPLPQQPQPTPLPQSRPQQPPQLQPQPPPTPAQPQPTLPQEDSQQTEQNPTQPGQQQPQPLIPPQQQQPQPPSDVLTPDMKCGLLPPGFVEGDPWPWTVEVMGGGGGCGGTLITSAHILAPAHCLSNPQRIEVVVGGRELPVLPLFHPEYDPFTQSNDLAILTLPSPLTQGQHGGEFMPACLPFRYNFDGFRYQTLTRIPPPASQNRKDRVEVEEVEVVGLHDCGPPHSSTFSTSSSSSSFSTFPNRVEVQQRKHLCGASTLSTSSLCDAGGSSLVFHDDYDTGFYYVVGVGSITNSCTPQPSGLLSPKPVQSSPTFPGSSSQSSPTFPGSSSQSSPTFPGRPQSVLDNTNESRPSLLVPGISVHQKPSQANPGDQTKPLSNQPSAALYTRVGAYLDWIVEKVNGL